MAAQSVLPCARLFGWMGLGEPTMQPRETAPLWVGLTFALMIAGTVAYLAGYFAVEDIVAYMK